MKDCGPPPEFLAWQARPTNYDLAVAKERVLMAEAESLGVPAWRLHDEWVAACKDLTASDTGT